MVKLSEVFHLLLLQSGGHFLYVVGQYLDDLMENIEHGLWNDLKHLQQDTHNNQLHIMFAIYMQESSCGGFDVHTDNSKVTLSPARFVLASPTVKSLNPPGNLFKQTMYTRLQEATRITLYYTLYYTLYSNCISIPFSRSPQALWSSTQRHSSGPGSWPHLSSGRAAGGH